MGLTVKPPLEMNQGTRLGFDTFLWAMRALSARCFLVLQFLEGVLEQQAPQRRRFCVLLVSLVNQGARGSLQNLRMGWLARPPRAAWWRRRSSLERQRAIPSKARSERATARVRGEGPGVAFCWRAIWLRVMRNPSA